MKVIVLLTLSVVVSVSLLGLVKQQKTKVDREDKNSHYQTIKLRVTRDVLELYQGELANLQTQVAAVGAEAKTRYDEMVSLQATADKKRGERDVCLAAKKYKEDEVAIVLSRNNELSVELEKQKTSWGQEVASLKQQIAERSKVCDFVKKDSASASELCGDEVIKEAPKQEEPKAEAPKQEEPKADAPKQEEPTTEAPKQEEPKAEAPKRR